MKTYILIRDITGRAGAERAVINLANILVKLGHEVSIVSMHSSEGSAPFPLAPAVQIVHKNYPYSRGSFIKRALTFIPRFITNIIRVRSLCADAIIGAGVVYNIPLSFSKAKIKIGCEHMNYDSATTMIKITRLITYHFLDAVVLLTPKDAQKYWFIKKGKCFVIPNSVPFAIPSSISHEGSKEILAVGRLTRQKGFDLLISAAKIIKEQHAGWHITIVGEGEDKGKILDQIKQSMLSDFISIEPPTDNIQSYYKRAAIYMMSSRWEGLPMVLLEAQAYGLPIVSFNCPEGPSEVIHDGQDGFLVPPNDCEQLALKITKLIEDPKMRYEFGKAAQENVSKYSEEIIAKKWADLFVLLNS